jgi:hypothetical protein
MMGIRDVDEEVTHLYKCGARKRLTRAVAAMHNRQNAMRSTYTYYSMSFKNTYNML